MTPIPAIFKQTEEGRVRYCYGVRDKDTRELIAWNPCRVKKERAETQAAKWAAELEGELK